MRDSNFDSPLEAISAAEIEKTRSWEGIVRSATPWSAVVAAVFATESPREKMQRRRRRIRRLRYELGRYTPHPKSVKILETCGMTQAAEKFDPAISDAVERLISRAENPRGLGADHLRPRVDKALGKYLFRENENPQHTEITGFIDELRSDDLCLIIACEHGDEKAWEDLVANFDSTVKSAARKISSNNEDAEDLASSIWAELYGLRQDAEGNKKSKLAYYSGRGSLAGWLRAVVSQLAIDQFRKQSKFVQIEETREFENLAEESSNHSNNHNVLHHTESPEELLSDKQASGDVTAALQAAISRLESEDKVILKMYYFDDCKLKDIAAAFGYHEATASRKLVRVQSDIRKSVEKELKKTHGWSDGEVKRHLAETAEKLGFSLEKMFAVMIVVALSRIGFSLFS